MQSHFVSFTQRMMRKFQAVGYCKGKVTALFVLSLSLGSAILSSAPGNAGTEIGNAHFVEYVNKLARFKLEFPEAWKHVDFGTAVTITESEPQDRLAPVSSSGVNVSVLPLGNIDSAEELQGWLHSTQSTRNWVEAKVDQRPAFYFADKDQRVIYVFRGRGDIVSIMCKVRNDETVKAFVQRILNSVKLGN